MSNAVEGTLFGSSGVRRIVDLEFIKLAWKIGLVLGRDYQCLLIGSDTRTTGEILRYALTSGIIAAGSRCSYAGIVPTPTLAIAAKSFKAGAVITASHNPPEYNGIKLLNPDGSAFDGEQRTHIDKNVLNNFDFIVPWHEITHSEIYDGAIEGHWNHILQKFPEKVKLKVVVDAGGGAASEVTVPLLKKMGCEVIGINCYPTGFFPRPSEPVESNLSDLIHAVVKSGADLGIAHDGDADRMMAVDERGRFINGDQLMTIFAQNSNASEVITTVDASMAIDELGFAVIRTRVGDSYVSERLKQRGDFGGESSGAWIFPESSYCPDGIYAAAKLVQIVSKEKLSRLVDKVPKYPIIRGQLKSSAPDLNQLQDLLVAMDPIDVNRIDGIRLEFRDGWLLIRPSGTEPKMRVTAEARTQLRASQIYDDGMQILRNMVNGKGAMV